MEFYGFVSKMKITAEINKYNEHVCSALKRMKLYV